MFKNLIEPVRYFAICLKAEKNQSTFSRKKPYKHIFPFSLLTYLV